MKIGRVTREIIDESRREVLDSGLEGKRRFMISIFYPVEFAWVDNGTGHYFDLFSPHIEKAVDSYNRIGIHLSNPKTNCYNDAPISDESLNNPIILFSPGMAVDRDMYLFQINQLVLSGYLVITIGASYESVVTVFPEGIVYQSEIVKNMAGNDFSSIKELMKIREEDIVCLLNQLEDWYETDTFFKGKLDVHRIGVIGHSLGGTTVFNVAKHDARIKAGIMLDGSLHLLSNIQSTDTPFLSIRQHHSSFREMKEIWDEEAATLFSKGQQALFDSLTDKKYFMKIIDANHMSFSDAPFIFQRKSRSEELASKLHKTINEVTIAFFHQFVKGESFDFDQLIQNRKEESPFALIDREGEIINV